MSNITEEEWEKIYENFDSQSILDALSHIDHARGYLADRENFRPPEIREQLFEMHTTAVDIVRHGSKDKEKIRELFDYANDLTMEISDLIEHLQKADTILDKLLELYPDSLAYDEE